MAYATNATGLQKLINGVSRVPEPAWTPDTSSRSAGRGSAFRNLASPAPGLTEDGSLMLSDFGLPFPMVNLELPSYV